MAAATCWPSGSAVHPALSCCCATKTAVPAGPVVLKVVSREQQASNSAAAEVQDTGGTVTVYPGLEEEGVAAPSAPAAVPELVRREPIALAGKAA